MASPLLSYVVATRNRLPYLRIMLAPLLASRKADEEIIIIDGNSTDGTQDYLQSLLSEGKIQAFLSEKDCCQAHAYNKGTLLATGQVIKPLTDDDAYNFDVLRQCAQYLVSHADLDVVCANVGSLEELSPHVFSVNPRGETAHYLKWVSQQEAFFWFGDQGFLFKRSSLPLVGFYHTGVICIDIEMSLRLTSQRQARMAWCDVIAAISIIHQESNSHQKKRIRRDEKRINNFYDAKVYMAEKESSSKRMMRSLEKSFRGLVRNLKKPFVKAPPKKVDGPGLQAPYEECFTAARSWFESDAQSKSLNFHLPNS